jgi:hypothetical protein
MCLASEFSLPLLCARVLNFIFFWKKKNNRDGARLCILCAIYVAGLYAADTGNVLMGRHKLLLYVTSGFCNLVAFLLSITIHRYDVLVEWGFAWLCGGIRELSLGPDV